MDESNNNEHSILDETLPSICKNYLHKNNSFGKPFKSNLEILNELGVPFTTHSMSGSDTPVYEINSGLLTVRQVCVLFEQSPTISFMGNTAK